MYSSLGAETALVTVVGSITGNGDLAREDLLPRTTEPPLA